MIPDFPRQKEKLRKLLDDYLDLKYQEYQGFLSRMPMRKHYEGDKWALEREDGTKESDEYKTLETMLSINIDDAPTMPLDQVKEKLDEVAREFARQMHQDFYESLNEITEKNNQVIDGKGREFTKELFLEMIDQIMIEFDKHGNPIFPALIMHPNLWERIREDVATWDDDPDFKAKHEEILESKRIQWRDRESHRKLVD